MEGGAASRESNLAAQGTLWDAQSHTDGKRSVAEWQGPLKTISGRERPRYIGLMGAAKRGRVR